VALASAAAFVGFVAVAARALLQNATARRAVQLLSFVLLVQSVFLLPGYLVAIRRLSTAEPWLLMLPPTWFVGLYATLAGSAQPLDHGLALVALGSLVASGLACRTSYRSAAERVAPGVSAARPGPIASLLERALNTVALRSAGARAAFWFVLAGLWRSPRHRLTLTGYGAVGLAASGLVGAVATRGAVLADPVRLQSLLVHATFVGIFFLLLGLRSAFDVPAELRANWLFRAAGPDAVGELRRGSGLAALFVATTPVLASLPVLAAAGFDAPSLLLHLAYGLLVANVAVRAALFRRRGMPLASAYVPGRANLRLRWPLYIGSFFGFVGVAAALERRLLRAPSLLASFVLAGILVSALMRLRERARAAEDTLLFDEEPEGMPSLELNG
jgi:hypothetical protein